MELLFVEPGQRSHWPDIGLYPRATRRRFQQRCDELPVRVPLWELPVEHDQRFRVSPCQVIIAWSHYCFTAYRVFAEGFKAQEARYEQEGLCARSHAPASPRREVGVGKRRELRSLRTRALPYREWTSRIGMGGRAYPRASWRPSTVNRAGSGPAHSMGQEISPLIPLQRGTSVGCDSSHRFSDGCLHQEPT